MTIVVHSSMRGQSLDAVAPIQAFLHGWIKVLPSWTTIVSKILVSRRALPHHKHIVLINQEQKDRTGATIRVAVSRVRYM